MVREDGVSHTSAGKDEDVRGKVGMGSFIQEMRQTEKLRGQKFLHMKLKGSAGAAVTHSQG